MINENFAQQGWQCPICKRVYSPFTPWCLVCGNAETYTTTTTGQTVTIKSPESDKWGNMDDLVNNFLHQQMGLDDKGKENDTTD